MANMPDTNFKQPSLATKITDVTKEIDSHSHHLTLIWQSIAQIISDVLSHTLTMPQQTEEIDNQVAIQTEKQTENQSAQPIPKIPKTTNIAPSCLIICHQDYIDIATHHLTATITQQIQSQHQLTPKLLFLDNTEFLASTYHQQYQLGCYIDTCLLQELMTNKQSNQTDTDNTDAKNTTATSLTAHISTRLRDIFAQHSLILTDSHSNLLAFGFVKMALPSLPSKDSKPINHTQTDDKRDKKNKAVDSQLDINSHDEMMDTIKNKLKIWQFNLYDYKPQPDWLNAKYWANPENFDKYRW